MSIMKSAEIHALLGNTWPAILAQLGVPEEFRREKVGNREKHGPCPACGGTDRYFFDNKHSRGDFYRRRCGAGDGFTLLRHVHGWSFAVARERVIEAAGLAGADTAAFREEPRSAAIASNDRATPDAPAVPTERVLSLRRQCCVIENCDDAVDYLASRALWPLLPGCTLRAHSTVAYWDNGKLIGRYPAVVADVLDIAGQLVTVHVTWLYQGKKLTGHQARKLLSKTRGRTGCAVRLMPATDVLGIAEGIETAMSAAALDDIPVWAATTASLLANFEPPSNVTTLRVYADRDEAGLTAALKLMERLQGRVRLEVRMPPAPAKDWNDVLIARTSRASGEETLE